jgi:hypothetical protein
MTNITFIDSMARTIIGGEVSRTATQVVVKNPAMINVAQAQNGQLQVQLIPLFFAEFISESARANGTQWSYNLSNITEGEVDVDARLLEQYNRVFTAATAQSVIPETPVIKLFDE